MPGVAGVAKAIVRLRHGLRPLYWRLRFRVLNAPWPRRLSLARKLSRRLEGTTCSVCGAGNVRAITFFSERRIEKCFCTSCQHIFSRHLRRDVDKAAALFAYDQPNEQYDGQRRLQIEAMRRHGGERGRFLDFGVGGNLGIAAELRRRYPGQEFSAADLYASDSPWYLQLYSSDLATGRFDGISSNAVIEHLDNTLEAWRYLNALLRPVAEGGGLMLHAFPSQLVEDLDHWAIKIASHECLFSPASLALVCGATGFEHLGWRYLAEVQHPVHVFRKVRDLA